MRIAIFEDNGYAALSPLTLRANALLKCLCCNGLHY
jgi:hypothetical protein